ncbi:MAG: DUF1684 domain-containing protein [Cyclobacteriaceae bacterium]|nr:DUF1684 domain-containing protein [Cyclobacteriaceae bacterium]
MRYTLLIISGLLLQSCAGKKELSPEALKAYKAEIATWQAKRVEDLKAPNGWLNLVGLHWLEPGINSFGSASSNTVIFPEGKIAAQAGYFFVKDNIVTITVNNGVPVFANGKAVTSRVIFHPDSARATTLTSGDLQWNIIQRDSKLGIRLRDRASAEVQSFTGIDRFELNPDYRIEARWEAADSARTIDITNVLGQTTPQRSPGTLVFKLEGKEQRLDALAGRDELFIIFADATSGHETYGGGRFVYTGLPDKATNTVVIDFNKAYNPPCVFTPYATCPLPPGQNVLSVAIPAGEKNYKNAQLHIAKGE